MRGSIFAAKVLIRRAAAMALVAAAALLLCFPSPAAPAPEAGGTTRAQGGENPGGRPHVVLVIIDALRADHLSCYGYGRETSPVIDRLAADGWLFLRNKSQASYTRTSMASLFTARYTCDANLIRRTDSRSGDGSGGEATTPAVRVPTGTEDTSPGGGGDLTLAEVLHSGGYLTAGISTNPQMKAEWGYARGFELYRMPRPEGRCIPLAQQWWLRGAKENLFYTDAAGAVEVFSEVLSQGAGDGRPLFFYIHLMDVHEPYIPPEEHQVFSEKPLELARAAELAGRFISGKLEDLRQGALDLYDAEIRFADWSVGRMIEELEARGLYENTVFIVAADHGEEFLDHGRTTHAKSLYEEVIRTPLVVRIPGRKPRTFEGLTRNVDIAPTILDLAGVEPGWADRDGASLIDMVERGEGARSAVARMLLVTPIGARHWRAIQKGELKYIHTLTIDTSFEELFDLAGDPAESEDLSSERSERAEALARALSETRGEEPTRPRVKIDEKTREVLRSLGYLH